jgi:acyl-coenzyme A thioesterase PaaI-like protein
MESTSVLNPAGEQMHRNCYACGAENPQGLNLKFSPSDDGSVTAELTCSDHLEGYKGWMHGGLITLLLDSAMTNCLFSHGYAAVTARLTVRFRAPVIVDQALTVSAWITRDAPPLHFLKAVIRQDGVVNSEAVGEFMERPDLLF